MTDLTQFAEASFIIIGFVNGVQFAINQEWKSFALWTTAVLAGLALGFAHWFGLPGPELGLAIGMGSSGVYKGIQLLKN